jgi:hypothetical protein
LNYLKFEDEEEKSQDIHTDKEWVKLSQSGVTWYEFNSNKEINIPECELYCNINGQNIILKAPVDNNILFEFCYEGTIRERFVEPGVDNLSEMKEWFEEYSAPYTIAIGFEQWLPDQKVLTPTYYAVKMDTTKIYDKWLMFMELKSLNQKEL